MTLIPFILTLGMALFYTRCPTQQRAKIAIPAGAKYPVGKFTLPSQGQF